MYASAFSEFWRQYPEYFRTAGKFIDAEPGEKNGVECFTEYLHSKPERLKAYLKDFLPATLQERFGIDNFEWVDDLIGDEGLLQRAVRLYEEDIHQLEAARERAFAGNKSGVDAYTQRIRVYKREAILAYLARRNLFPKYGFPVDTVEMTIVDHKGTQRAGLQLQRDLSMAISEYAPGSQIVANGNLLTSRYIRKIPGMSWKMSRFCTCKNCGSLNLKLFLDGESDEPYELCDTCGSKLERLQEGVYLIPEWGFETDGTAKRPGLKKPLRTFRTDAAYIGNIESSEPQNMAIGKARVLIRSGSSEEMAMLNKSKFFVCTSCGYADHDEKCFTSVKKKAHNRASGAKCNNTILKKYSLAYRFETDILELQFDSPMLKK